MTENSVEAPEIVPTEAAAPLPAIGSGVSYYPRTGELRAGKGVHAAIVTAVDEEARTLDLVVVYDADDFIGMRRIPARIGGEGMGWELSVDPARAALERRLSALEAAFVRQDARVFGSLDMGDGETVLGVLDEHEDRLDQLEDPARVPQARATVVRPKAKAKAKAPTRRPAVPAGGDPARS